MAPAARPPGAFSFWCLVFDPQVGPERPPHDLRLGTALLYGACFEGSLLVLVEVRGLSGESALRGVLLPRAGRLGRFRHAERVDNSVAAVYIHGTCTTPLSEKGDVAPLGQGRRVHLLMT